MGKIFSNPVSNERLLIKILQKRVQFNSKQAHKHNDSTGKMAKNLHRHFPKNRESPEKQKSKSTTIVVRTVTVKKKKSQGEPACLPTLRNRDRRISEFQDSQIYIVSLKNQQKRTSIGDGVGKIEPYTLLECKSSQSLQKTA